MNKPALFCKCIPAYICQIINLLKKGAYAVLIGIGPELVQILISCLPKRESKTARIEACYCRCVKAAYRTA
jgi:hypothetical protein